MAIPVGSRKLQGDRNLAGHADVVLGPRSRDGMGGKNSLTHMAATQGGTHNAVIS